MGEPVIGKRQSGQAWALELGGSAVRLALVTRDEFGQYRLEHGSETRIENRWEGELSWAQAVRDLAGETPADPLVMAIPDELVLTRVLSLPAAKGDTLAKMIGSQMEVLLPARGDLFTCFWSHWPDPFKSGQVQAILCAVRKDTLERASQAAPAGSQLAAIMPASLALASGQAILAGPSQECVVLVDVAARSTSLVFLYRGLVVQIGHVDEGADHWTERLAEDLHLPLAEADVHKLGWLECAHADGDEVDRGSMECSFIQWAQHIREVFDSCLAEIPPAHRPTACVLFGGVTKYPAVRELIVRTLRVSARPADPPANLQLCAGSDYAAMATAIGAAAAQLDAAIPACRLTMGRAGSAAWSWQGLGAAGVVQKAWQSLANSPRRRLVAVVGLLVALLLCYGLDVHERSWQADAADRLGQSAGQEGGFERQLAVGRYLDDAGATPLAVLEEISTLAPPSALVSSWRYSRGGDVVIGGTVGSDADLHGFMKRLSESPLFSEVLFQNAKGGGGKLRFELMMRLASANRLAASQPTSRPALLPASAPSSTPAVDAGAAPVSARPASGPVLGGPAPGRRGGDS